MRVILIASSYPPVVGGGETYAHTVATGLVQRGHEVHVVTDLPRAGPCVPGSSSEQGVTVTRLAGYRDALFAEDKLPWEQMLFGLHPEMEAVISRSGPDIVLTNSLDAAFHGRIVASQYGIPWAAAFHEHAPQAEPLGEGRLRLVYGMLRPDVILAGSEFYVGRARRFGDGSRVELIYHGVDSPGSEATARSSAVRQQYGVAGCDILVVCVGRLKARKGMTELVRAVRAVRRADSRVRLVIAGSVSSASRAYATALYAAIAEPGLAGYAVIDESVDVTRVPALLAAADIVAQPSHEEGLGLAALEGMAAGKPVIVTDVPGFREILTAPDIACVIPVHDEQALAGAISRLAASQEERTRLGRRGRRHVDEHFSKAVMVDRIETVLSELTEPRKAKTP